VFLEHADCECPYSRPPTGLRDRIITETRGNPLALLVLPDARRLLLVAAAEPAGDPVLLWRAAERLGIDLSAAAPATGVEGMLTSPSESRSPTRR
jgi:hypothetical protein